MSMDKLKIASIIVSLGPLAMCLTFASWVLLSHPISIPVKYYLNSVNGVADLSSSSSCQTTISSDINNTKNALNVSMDLQQSLESGKSDANQNDRNDVNQDKEMDDDGEFDLPLSEGTNNNIIEYSPHSSLEGECDLFHGEWHYDKSESLYTNNSCPIIADKWNCQRNGRPDKGFENWRWKPSQCVLPKFDANKFLELMSGKTVAFFGDSLAQNQMLSLLCILWQVEVPKISGHHNVFRWYFKSKSVTIVKIWSSWLVNQTKSAFKDIPKDIAKVFLDIPDETLMEHAPEFDVIVISSGHWFTTKSVYLSKNKVVGGHLWAPPNGQKLLVKNVEAFRVAGETTITALATHQNYSGVTILRSYSPDHYTGGAWNTCGSCTCKVEPVRADQVVHNEFTNLMYETQVAKFNQAVKKRTNGSKLRLMGITKAFSFRHDGHPGPYSSNDPNKITTLRPDGSIPSQDCVHWCLPGPINTWNEFLLDILKREFEK